MIDMEDSKQMRVFFKASRKHETSQRRITKEGYTMKKIKSQIWY